MNDKTPPPQQHQLHQQRQPHCLRLLNTNTATAPAFLPRYCLREKWRSKNQSAVTGFSHPFWEDPDCLGESDEGDEEEEEVEEEEKEEGRSDEEFFHRF